MVKTRNIVKCKKGWIRLVEVFVAIVLLASVLLLVSTKNSSYDTSLQDQIYKKEAAMLRDIELNNTLRTQILSIPQGSLPLEWEGLTSQLDEVSSRITLLAPANLECRAKLCTLNDACIMNWATEGDLYARSAVIAADLNTYSPRQLKLFCTPKSG